MKITWDEVQANRRDARFRRLNLMGHGCVVLLAMLSVCVLGVGCAKKPQETWNVGAPASQSINVLGGVR